MDVSGWSFVLLLESLSTFLVFPCVFWDNTSNVGKLPGTTDILFLPNTFYPIKASDPALEDALVWPYVIKAALGLGFINASELTAYRSLPIVIFRVLESLKNLREVGLVLSIGLI